MKFGYTIIFVADIPATIDFYKQAFGLDCEFLAESGLYAQLATGATKLGLVSDQLAHINNVKISSNTLHDKAAGIVISFVTDDVQGAYKKACDSGAVPLTDPEQKPWGQLVGNVRDCNGVIVELCSSMS